MTVATLQPTLVRLKAPPLTPLDKLIGLSLNEIGQATAKLNAGGSLKAWQQAMEKVLTQAHTAAFITSTAQRLGVPPDSPLISRSRLSRAERADITKAVQNQLGYLRGFVADVQAGQLSPAQIAARANLYGPSIRPFYYQQRWGDWQIPDQLIPGNQACLGNCRCTISVADNGDGTGVLTRVLGGERHCSECPPLAGDHQVRRRAA